MPKRTKSLIGWSLAALAAGALCSVSAIQQPVVAHGIFKKTLEKKYKDQGLKVTCNMCHVPKEGKEKRNEFGEMFFKILKEKDLSAQWDALKGAERKEFEDDVMAPAFLEALKEVAEKETDEGEKYGELIEGGKIEGSKLK